MRGINVLAMLGRTLITSLILLILWFLLSGHLDPLLICLGIISCLFITWVSLRLSLLDLESHRLQFNLNLPKFLPWFFIEVVKSNIEVSWRILHPKLPINTNISSVPVSQHSDLGKVVYANCITLTPGTYSIDINPDFIEVHSLTKKLAANLHEGEMGKRILALEANSSNKKAH